MEGTGSVVKVAGYHTPLSDVKCVLCDRKRGVNVKLRDGIPCCDECWEWTLEKGYQRRVNGRTLLEYAQQVGLPIRKKRLVKKVAAPKRNVASGTVQHNAEERPSRRQRYWTT